MASAGTIRPRGRLPPRTGDDDPARSAFIDQVLGRRLTSRAETSPVAEPEVEQPREMPEPKVERYCGCRQARWHPTPKQEIDICLKLWRRRQAGQIPRVWIDSGRMRIEVGGSPAPLVAIGTVRMITWRQAQRIAAGESVEEVLG